MNTRVSIVKPSRLSLAKRKYLQDSIKEKNERFNKPLARKLLDNPSEIDQVTLLH